MEDRLNTVEAQLETDLKAETAITDEFNLIERGFREEPRFSKHQYPVLVFEVYASKDADDDDVFEIEEGQANIIVHGGDLATTRQTAKKYVSLIRDFLKSTAWTYVYDTKIGRSEVLVTKEPSGYRAWGLIPFETEVHLKNDTAK